MRTSGLIFTLLLYLLNTSSANLNLPYGSSCSLQDGEVGVCVDIANCPLLGRLLRDRLIAFNSIVICNESLRYMCCPSSMSNKETTTESAKSTVSIQDQEKAIASVFASSHTQTQTQQINLKNLEIHNKKYSCGSSGKTVSLIVNGTRSERGAWPWMVTLHRFQTNDLFCGGSLISSNAVVTAAHCMQDKQQKFSITPNEFVVKLGRYDLSQIYERDAVDAYPIDIFIHNNWKFFTRDYDSDIAIIKLSAPVKFSDVISPICLWKSNNPLSVSTGTIVGYGKSERDTIHENIPRELEMTIITNEECFLKGPRFSYISSINTLCAGRDEYSAACRGDSGNGLFVKVNDRWFLRGIISASFLDINNTCDTSADTLFTNVLKFQNWIESKAPTTQQFEEELPTAQEPIPLGKEIVCSFTSWAVYRKKGGRFTADTFDPNMCTTAIYHFAGLDDNFNVKPSDMWLDLPDNGGFNGYRKFTGLKKSHPHLRLLLSVGGWNEGVEKFSKLVANETLRKNFARQSAEYLKQFDFDGMNFYWDFPGDTSRGGTDADKENLSLLLKEISKIYKEQDLYLSASLRTRDWIVRSAYDLEEVSKYVDAINMITFDYSSSWDKKIGYPAAIKTTFQDDDIDTAVNSFIDQNVPRNKLIMGVMFQAQTYKTDTDGYIGDECEQQGFPGPIIQSSVLVGYNEICRMESQKEWTYEFDRVASQMIGRFKENGTTHVAVYDTPRSVANKVKYAMEKGFLGMWAWSIDTDDFRGECSIDNTTYADYRGNKPNLIQERDFPLLKTMNDAMKFMIRQRN